MEATITGEGDGIVGLYVVDNNEGEHLIEMDHSGEVTGYQPRSYPNNPAKRSDDESIHMEQANFYAKYYVQRERGYPTFEPRLTPEWIAHVLGAVFLLDFEEFERHFGDYAQQYRSSLRPDVEPVVEGPYGEAGGGVVFRADVFVGLVFQEYLDDPGGFDSTDDVATITDDYDLVTALSERVTELLDPDADPIEEVSDLDVLYQTRSATGSVEEKTVGERTHTRDRPADAQLQMTPPQTTLERDLPTETVQGLVLHHLTCQVRDAYLRLGLEPPEAFRILGQGMYKQTIRYQHTDVFEPYHLTDADIDGYRSPGFDTGGVDAGALAASPDRNSLRSMIKRALFGE